jgi:transmembrane sensor
MGRDFDAELRREEAVRQTEGIPAEERRAIWARLEATIDGAGERAGRRSWLAVRASRAATAVGAGRARVAAAAVAVVVLVAVGITVAPVVGRRPPAQLGELDVLQRSGDLAARVEGGLVQIERGSATLADRAHGLTIETVGPVALRRAPDGVRIVRGRIEVTVAHRPQDAPPATVFVSHGAIEVMGTAFTIVQDASAGHVALRAGSIRFRGTDGAVVVLRPGEELSWPPPAPEPTASRSPAAAGPPPAPSPPPIRPAPAATATPTDQLLERIEELRSRNRYEEAARTLRRAIPAQPAPMRERLSFELGSLLTYQMRDAHRACAHWASHQRRFQGGRYRDEVMRARRALACPGSAAREATVRP